jgi:hypothetical protein
MKCLTACRSDASPKQIIRLKQSSSIERTKHSHLAPIKSRYHRISVSGVTRVLSSFSTLRPDRLAFMGSRRLSASVNCIQRSPKRSLRRRVSSCRYSMTSSCWRLTQRAKIRSSSWKAGESEDMRVIVWRNASPRVTQHDAPCGWQIRRMTETTCAVQSCAGRRSWSRSPMRDLLIVAIHLLLMQPLWRLKAGIFFVHARRSMSAQDNSNVIVLAQ